MRRTMVPKSIRSFIIKLAQQTVTFKLMLRRMLDFMHVARNVFKA